MYFQKFMLIHLHAYTNTSGFCAVSQRVSKCSCSWMLVDQTGFPVLRWLRLWHTLEDMIVHSLNRCLHQLYVFLSDSSFYFLCPIAQIHWPYFFLNFKIIVWLPFILVEMYTFSPLYSSKSTVVHLPHLLLLYIFFLKNFWLSLLTCNLNKL